MEKEARIQRYEVFPRFSGIEQRENQPMGKTYKLVILDFHGTMTDHQLRTIRAYHHAAHEAFGVHLGKVFYQDALTRPSHASQHNGKKPETNEEFIRRQFQDAYGEDQIRTYLTQFRRYMETTYIPIPGIVKIVKTLMQEGIHVAVLTNGSQREVIQDNLERWGLPNLSEDLYSSHITGVRKPNKATIQRILDDYKQQGIHIQPHEVLAVGDYIDDIRTAHNIGVDSALMTRGNGWEHVRLREPKPTYVITTPFELVGIVHGEVPPETREEFELAPLLWKQDRWGPQKK